MIVINKSVFCGNLDGARLLGHPVYALISANILCIIQAYLKLDI